SVSILAREHGIPFYIAAPSSTFDLSIKSGDEIPIEQRAAEEVTTFGGPPNAKECVWGTPGKTQIAPDDVKVYNPAFDVTDASKITAIITEKGIIENPDTDSISRHLRS
ncbi:MAG: hypothetical protein ACYTDW_11785, partial [Planctomycetota bacterium]